MVRVDQYFDLKYGSGMELYDLEKASDGINFVARTAQNNGVVAKVKPVPGIAPNPAGTISVAVSGSVMESFVQEKPYYSGYHIIYLTPKIKMTLKQMLFYCMCLRANKFRYGYGRQANKTLPQIRIPSVDEMPAYVDNVDIPPMPGKMPKLRQKITLPPTEEWGRFKISELFSVRGTKTTSLEELRGYGEGRYPYVTTQAMNNGVAGHYDFFTEEGGVITVDSAVLGFTSYQPDNFSASDHVEKLIPKFEMNAHMAMFLVTILNEDQFRYNYGRKASQTRIESREIRLPIQPDGSPDFRLMGDYIKSLPFSSSI